eukprot:3377903-Alexandrium_andersonii.AAC.1
MLFGRATSATVAWSFWEAIAPPSRGKGREMARGTAMPCLHRATGPATAWTLGGWEHAWGVGALSLIHI